jgi:hypothetical protein
MEMSTAAGALLRFAVSTRYKGIVRQAAMGVRNPTYSKRLISMAHAWTHASRCGVLPAVNKMFAPTETRKRSSAMPGAPLGNIEKSLCMRLSVLWAGADLKPLYDCRVSPLSGY